MLRLYMQQNLTQIPEEAIAGLWWNVGDSDAVRLRVEELPNTQQNTRKKRRFDADLTGSDMADLLTKKFRSGVLAWGKHSNDRPLGTEYIHGTLFPPSRGTLFRPGCGGGHHERSSQVR